MSHDYPSSLNLDLFSSPYVVIQPQKEALKAAIVKYAGKKTIVIPQSDAGFIVDEPIITTKINTHIVNMPPRSCKITLAAGGYISIENPDADGDWNSRSWILEGLRLDMNSVATRAITTEYGASGRRTCYPQIKHCTIDNPAANSICMNMKDTESLLVDSSRIYPLNNTSIGIRLFNSEDRKIGNQILSRNTIFTDDAAHTGGKAIQFDGSISDADGGIGSVSMFGNRYIGTQGYDGVAFDFIDKTNVSMQNFVSIGDRFEALRILQTSANAAASMIANIKIDDFWHSSLGVVGATLPIVFWSAKTYRCKLLNGQSVASGNDEDAVVFCHNDGVNTNEMYNAILHCTLGWDKDIGAANSYLVNDGAIWVHECYGSDGKIADIN